MAVPKKRMSRTRKLLRRAQWNLLLRSQALKALSLGYSKQLAGSKEKID
jgi:ribosomal protein L32